MRHNLLALAVFLVLSVVAQSQTPAHVCIRHLVPPSPYPIFARLARLQGTVEAKLKIAADGSVTEAVVESQDSMLVAHPILQSETERLLRGWTLECLSCAPGAPFEHVIKFHYRLEGEDAQYADTKVSMDLPNEITITARPPLCDHCPVSNKKH